MDDAGKQTIGLIDNNRFNGIPAINDFHDDYLNPSGQSRSFAAPLMSVCVRRLSADIVLHRL